MIPLYNYVAIVFGRDQLKSIFQERYRPTIALVETLNDTHDSYLPEVAVQALEKISTPEAMVAVRA